MKVDFKRRYCRKLFTWKELETLINIRPLMTTERVNIPSHEGQYRWDNNCWTNDPNCYPSSLLKMLIENNICYLDDMSTCTEKINSFAEKLERQYKLPVDAHIYICRNPKLSHPFGTHFDYNNNVIVQCEGKTNFKVWNEVKDKSQRQDNMTVKEDPVWDVDMNPGDAIWIPKYYPHLATSKTKRLSVSFPLKATSTLIVKRSWVKL